MTTYEAPRDSFPRPRLPVAVKHQVIARIVACTDEAEAAKIAEFLWAKLRGDMQDRITTLIYAAKAAVEAKDMNARRDLLAKALQLLNGREIAATTIPKPDPKGRRVYAPKKARSRKTAIRTRTNAPRGGKRSRSAIGGAKPDLATHAAEIEKGVPRPELLAARFTRSQLAEWGVAWPPPRGWRKRLERLAEQERTNQHSDSEGQ